MLTVVPKTRLVGRRSELGLLEAELRRAAAGELRCVLLVGEAGIGKSRIADELLDRNRGCSTGLRARAHQSRKTMPLSLWVEALEGELRSVPGDRLKALCGGFMDDLAPIFRSLAAVDRSAAPREASGMRQLEGLTVLLDNLTREAPLTLLFDDLPRADATSLEALDYVARGLRQSRILVVATARSVELDSSLAAADLVTQLEQDGRLRRLRLAPLDHGGVRQLAGEVLDGVDPPAPLVDWLERRSRGNPLFAIGLLRALVEEGGDLTRPRLRQLPEDLTQRVRIRCRQLDPQALRVLETLAVHGSRVDLEGLKSLDLVSDDTLTEVLDRLVRAGLIVEHAFGRQAVVEIVHPLVQEAVYAHMSIVRRRAVHRRLARAFARQGQPGAAAPHFAVSAEVGDAEAIEALMTALERPQQAYREAMAILRSLADLLPARDPRWLDLLDFLYQHGPLLLVKKDELDLETVPRVLSEIGRTLEDSTDLRRRGEVRYCLGTFLATDQGDLQAAETACREALQLFESAGDEASARAAASSLAWIRAAAGDFPGQISPARVVSSAAESAGDWRTAVFGMILGTYLCDLVGRFAMAESSSIRCLELVRRRGREAFLSEVLALRGSMLGFAGRLADARSVLDDALAVTPAAEFTLTLALRTEVEWLGGAFTAAVRNGLEGARSIGTRLARNRAHVLSMAVMAAAEVGNLDEAGHILAMATATYGQTPFWTATWQCTWAEGFLLTRAGRVGEGLENLEEAASGLLDLGALPLATFVLADLAEVGARAGLRGTAEHAAARLDAISVRLDTPLYRALAGLAGSWASLAGGDATSAERSGRLAVGLLAGSGYEAFHARCLEALGRALAEGDQHGAAEVLNQAADTFSRCRAVWRRERVEKELTRLGQRRRRGTAGVGPQALSPRERQVAALAAQAYTAREIAEQLSIGIRTVETHLDNVYTKLGISSKSELVRRARELNL